MSGSRSMEHNPRLNSIERKVARTNDREQRCDQVEFIGGGKRRSCARPRRKAQHGRAVGNAADATIAAATTSLFNRADARLPPLISAGPGSALGWNRSPTSACRTALCASALPTSWPSVSSHAKHDSLWSLARRHNITRERRTYYPLKARTTSCWLLDAEPCDVERGQDDQGEDCRHK
jgi:hypothetical protein